MWEHDGTLSPLHLRHISPASPLCQEAKDIVWEHDDDNDGARYRGDMGEIQGSVRGD